MVGYTPDLQSCKAFSITGTNLQLLEAGILRISEIVIALHLGTSKIWLNNQLVCLVIVSAQRQSL